MQILSASPGHTSLSAAETEMSNGSISVALHTRCFDQSEGSLQGPSPSPPHNLEQSPGVTRSLGANSTPGSPLATSQGSPSLEKLSSGLYSHTGMAVRVVVPGAPSHPRCSFIGSAGCLLSTYYRPSAGQGGGQQTPSHPQAAPHRGSRRGAGLGGDDHRVGGTAGS